MPTPKHLLRLLDTRDGHVCVVHGYDTGRLVPQHRAGGMGGGKSKHRPENVLWLDSLSNGFIESDSEQQRMAMARGIKVSKFVDPARVPVFYAHEWSWFRLVRDDREPVTGPEAMEMMHAVYGDSYVGWHGGWRNE